MSNTASGYKVMPGWCICSSKTALLSDKWKLSLLCRPTHPTLVRDFKDGPDCLSGRQCLTDSCAGTRNALMAVVLSLTNHKSF